MTTERIKTLYESPDRGLGQTFVYQDMLYPDSVIIVKTNGRGQEAQDMLLSKGVILSVAKQLKANK